MLALITRDLFFGSKVTGTAQLLGITVATCATLERLREQLPSPDLRGVILDLSAGIAPADVTGALPEQSRIASLAFGSHVETALLAAAHAAGFDHVLPRSRFSAELPHLLAQLDSAAE